jgi:cysteine desulfurase
MAPFLDDIFGNPSSIHAAGRQARAAVETARAQVAALLGALPEEVHFTSGGTEADNWALHRRRCVISSTIEHPAVLRAAEALAEDGAAVHFVGVGADGRLDPAAVLAATEGFDTDLVSLILANNETGTLQPLADIGPALRERGITFHVDAVQACGKIPVDVEALGVDLLSLSAHKINGPKGVGALYVRRGTPLSPWLHGGGREQGLRAGTENVAGIVGLGAAAALRAQDMAVDALRLAALRERLKVGIAAEIEDVVVNGSQTHCLPQTLNLSFCRIEAESVLLGLDMEGIAVSGGSACAAGHAEPSHVLLAMGMEPRLAAGAVRFSLGYGNDAAQVDRVIEVLPAIVARLRSLSVY